MIGSVSILLEDAAGEYSRPGQALLGLDAGGLDPRPREAGSRQVPMPTPSCARFAAHRLTQEVARRAPG